jgi:hypothetical protein
MSEFAKENKAAEVRLVLVFILILARLKTNEIMHAFMEYI